MAASLGGRVVPRVWCRFVRTHTTDLRCGVAGDRWSFPHVLTPGLCFAIGIWTWPSVRLSHAESSGESIREQVMQMRTREIQAALRTAGEDTATVFEREDLVDRLVRIRSQNCSAKSTVEPSDRGHPGALLQQLRTECRPMRVAQLRTRLASLDVPWADAIEKEDLVERLAQTLTKERANFCLSGRCRPGHVAELSLQELQEELADASSPLLLDVYSSRCGPCVRMAPELDKAVRALQRRIRVVKVNDDENSVVVSSLHIRAVPTLILFDRSGKEVSRREGFHSEQQLVELVESHGF